MTIEDIDTQRAAFHSMEEGTALDWSIIAHHNLTFAAGLPDRMLAHLRMLEGDAGGFAVDRLEHSLQTATRAYRADRDDEYVVCALLHDIGDILGPYNHADIAASVLKPFVSDANHWMVEKHGVFQGYYFFHHLGLDRDMREQFRGHEWFDYTAEFCADYDQPAFDPAYDTLPLEHFEPLVREVFANPSMF
jgi:predicted HD phosphohydrolase